MDDVFNSDLNGEIIISPHNKMRSTFGIIRVGESDLDSILQIGHEALLESELRVRAPKHDDLNSSIDVKYPAEDDLASFINVRNFSDMQSILEVPVTNKMTGMFNVIEPPRETATLSAIKDTYVRSDAPALNYGRERTMIAGTSADGQNTYWSLVQFEDVRETISQNLIIESAKVKLYFDESVDDLPQLTLDTIDGYWGETDVTWYKRPLVGDYHLDEYEINTTERYVEFDVTDIMIEIHNSSKRIDGFYIRRDETDIRRLASFGTKERDSRNPELNVVYYNPNPHSDGRAEVHGLIDVKHREINDLESSLEVHSDWGWEDLSSEIFVVHQKERIGEIIVNKGNIPSEITVIRSDYSDLESEIVIKQEEHELRDGVITVSKGNLPADLTIEAPKEYGYSDLEASIDVYMRKWNDIEGSFIVNKGSLDSSIIVRRETYDELSSVIDVKFRGYSKLESSLVISKGSLPAGITVQNYKDIKAQLEVYVPTIEDHSDLDGLINVKGYDYSQIISTFQVGYEDWEDIYGSIIVTKKNLPAEIAIRQDEESVVNAEIVIRKEGHSRIESSIVVTRELLHSYIEVLERDDLESSIIARQEEWEGIDGEVYVLFRDDLDSEIEVEQLSEIEASINVYTPYLKGVIVIPYDGHEDIEGSIIARVRWADDLTSSIVVYSDSMSGGYYYIL